MDRETLNRTLLGIDETVEGRQILDLFRATPAVLAKPGDLDAVEKLFLEYKQLHARNPTTGDSAKRNASPHE